MDETLAAAQLERVQALAETMVGAASQTIRPVRATSEGTTTRGRADEALAVLRRLGPGSSRVVLGETLGRGGMGLVRLGQQLSMGRDVAVKTTRTDRRSERTTLELLREAWVTGALEHPNILPIYDVGIDEQGAPVIVMRRVDGEDWDALMRAGETVAARYGEADLLEWNLRVLMQVCSALSRAHERELIHRDLKPANVMLGRFGEVYLVDWGIAVSVGDDGDGRFPRPEPQGQVVGTPAYMAPEMLAGRSEELGPRTDVYLAGAVLYEILVGRAPHRQGELGGFVDSVMHSPPAIPAAAAAPDELAAICTRAMAADPEQRYASTEELRLALAGFLRHRSSLRLADEGQARLEQLRVVLGGDERAGVQQLFSEARFALETALREWEDNARAEAGLRELLIEMAGEHLRRGEHEAAAGIIAELDPAPAELIAGLERLRAELTERERERERLERLGRDHDARFGQRTRWVGLAVLGTIWSISPLGAARVRPAGYSLWEIAALLGVFLVIAGALAVSARESLMATSYNRKFIATVMGTQVFQLVLLMGASLSGWTTYEVLAPQFFLWFVVTASVFLLLERRLWAAPLGYLAAYLAVSALEPRVGESLELTRLSLNIMSAAHATLTVNCLIMWRPRSLFRRLPDEELRGSG